MTNPEELTDRELDALVAVKVTKVNMLCSSCGHDGYSRERRPDGYTKCLACELKLKSSEWGSKHIPNYSTSIEAAWEVVEKMRKDGWNFSIGNGYKGNNWRVHFTERLDREPFRGGLFHEANADKAPRTICEAALKAVGVE